ncbi:MAG: aminopeptidase P family protein [Acidobacteria bacterium]|nr:aminopeptidase P family protein [Acidobacteriota bacterium]
MKSEPAACVSIFNRRRFLQQTLAATSLGALAKPALSHPPLQARSSALSLPSVFDNLAPLGSRIHSITPAEFSERIAHAQRVMADPKLQAADSTSTPPQKYDALFFAPGTSLYYFTGVHWGLSERLLGLVLPREGTPIMVVPGFEEGRLRERLHISVEIHAWQEDESPAKLAAQALVDRGIRSGRIGVEETAGFTFFDHFRKAAPGFEFDSADPVTIACRGRKSAHELELMRLACDATFDVFRAVFTSLKEGMSQDDIGRWIEDGFAKMNLQGGALVLIGASAALPHGSIKPQTLKPGDVVLIDGGTKVEGYESDVTRTIVFGQKPPDNFVKVFDTLRKAQDAALDAARAGRLSGTVDDAARAVVTSAGYGPGYKFFTHRLGHGIGLDGHEHPYLVRGSKTVLQSNMTFSNEPGIYVPGDFGIRCEDDMVIMPEGPAQLLTPGFAISLEKPFA